MCKCHESDFDCIQGRACPARESASRAFDVPSGARLRLVIALMVASAAFVVAIAVLPTLLT